MLVRTPDAGVPRAGVVRVGLVSVLFVRVSVEFLLTSVSLVPVGSVKVPPDTVIAAMLGVVSAGELENTRTHPLPVSSVTAVASCAEVNDPSDVAFHTEVTTPVRLAFVVTFHAVSPDAVPVRFVATPLEGVPSAGVTSVGEFANTKAPLHVSSLITPASCDDVVDAN